MPKCREMKPWHFKDGSRNPAYSGGDVYRGCPGRESRGVPTSCAEGCLFKPFTPDELAEYGPKKFSGKLFNPEKLSRNHEALPKFGFIKK